MNKLILTIFSFAVIVVACTKTNYNNSKTVHIPTLVLKGPAVYSTAKGTGTYVDPGAILTDENNVVSTLTTPSGALPNLAKENFYSVVYNKTTQYNYNLTVSRLVLVTGSTRDLSGQYARSTNGVIINLTKNSAGLYTIDNVGGVANTPANAAYIVSAFMGQLSNDSLYIPTQNNANVGSFYCDNTSYIPGPAGKDTLKWVVENGSFGTSVRTFIKQ